MSKNVQHFGFIYFIFNLAVGLVGSICFTGSKISRLGAFAFTLSLLALPLAVHIFFKFSVEYLFDHIDFICQTYSSKSNV